MSKKNFFTLVEFQMKKFLESKNRDSQIKKVKGASDTLATSIKFRDSGE